MKSIISGISVMRLTQMACLALSVILLGVLLVVRKPWEIPSEAWTGKPAVPICVEAGLWWAGLVNAGILMILGFAASFWTRPLPIGLITPRPPVPRWFWMAVGMAVLTSAGLNAPRLDAGFWDDEEYSVRRSIAGSFRDQKDDTLKFRPVKWKEAVWYYAKPNNHMLNSVLAKASNDIWKAVTKPDGLPYNEVAIRLPAFFAGLSSLVAIAWLLLRLGYPGAGAMAAWLLAIHPWHARFVPEARGYAFVFLILPLCCLFALRAAESGRWKWWIAYGASQFLLMAAWPGSLEFLVLLNAGVLAMTLFSSKKEFRWIVFGRFVVTCLLAGMATLLLLAPCVPQFVKFSQTMQSAGLPREWFVNVASRFLTGFPWTFPGTPPSAYPNTSHLFGQIGPLAWVMMVLAGSGLILGVIRILACGGKGLYFLPLFLFGAPLFIAIAMAKNLFILEWYVVGALPGIVALVAIGLSWPLDRISATSGKTAGGVAILLCAGFLVFQWQFLTILQHRPISPVRESVLLTRAELNPHSKENKNILTAGALGTPLIYDPRCRQITSHAELLDLMQTSKDSKRPLFINQSYTNITRGNQPELAALLFNASLFEHIHLPGIEPMFDRDVFILRNTRWDP